MTNKQTADALLEIGCEELPPRYFFSDNFESLKGALDGFLIAHHLKVNRDQISVEATPRRMVFKVKGLSAIQPATEKEVQGPKQDLGYKADGTLTPAGEGFLRKIGAHPDEVVIQDGRMVVVKKEAGKPTRELLAGIFKCVFEKIQFTKTMRWEMTNARFARPIRWIVALYGNDIVDLEIAGVKSGRKTKLHPLNNPREIEVENLSDYEEKLRKGHVILEKEDRQKNIMHALDHEASGVEGTRFFDRDTHDLMDKVTMMVESPGILIGRIKEEYMQMPLEVLKTAMREHQQYFAVQDQQRNGKLKPYFLAVHDNPFAQGDAMRPGCERVLEARLKDAQFFYQEDMKHPLPTLVPKLERVLWIKGLGNLLDKTIRLQRLGSWLGEKLEPKHREIAEQAAYLAKADLITNMVQEKEYTSLQGIMGGIYASAQGQPEAVAQAIGAQYLPRWANDVLPQPPAGRVLALADKLDHLVGCWGAGFVPTGAKDPYALRRAAQGIVAILLGAGYRLPLSEALQQTVSGFEQFKAQSETIVANTKDFIMSRLETELQNRNMAPDLIQAVLAVWWDDVTALVQKAEAIHHLRTGDGFNEKIVTFSRVVNILLKETPRKILPGTPELPVDQGLLTEEAERQLFAAYQRTGQAIAAHSLAGDFKTAFAQLADLKPLIDQFFDKVLVMDKSEKIRMNRLHLLTNLARTIWTLADFSKLVINQ